MSSTSRPRRAATRKPAIESNSDNETDTYEPSPVVKPKRKAPTATRKAKPPKKETVGSDSDIDQKPPVAKRSKVSKKEDVHLKKEILQSNSDEEQEENHQDRKIPAKRTKITKQKMTDVVPITEKLRNQQRLSKRFDFPTKTWTEPELLAQLQQLDYSTAKCIIQLFEDDNTIPFICRYRKETIGDLSPDQ